MYICYIVQITSVKHNFFKFRKLVLILTISLGDIMTELPIFKRLIVRVLFSLVNVPKVLLKIEGFRDQLLIEVQSMQHTKAFKNLKIQAVIKC